MIKKIIKTLTISICAAALVTAMPFTVTAKPKNLSKSVNVEDTVYFGKYEQDGNTKNGKEEIEWQVLEKKGNKALLISKKVLDVQPYNKEFKDITWAKCTLRKWLNKDFMKAAFNDKEIKKIQKYKRNNKEYRTKGGKYIIDKVFPLSGDEAAKYCKTDEKRKAEITNYGIKRIAKVLGKTEKKIREELEWFSESKNVRVRYWLRSPGFLLNSAAIIDYDGLTYEGGEYIHNGTLGVRPALWVNLN